MFIVKLEDGRFVELMFLNTLTVRLSIFIRSVILNNFLVNEKTVVSNRGASKHRHDAVILRGL